MKQTPNKMRYWNDTVKLKKIATNGKALKDIEETRTREKLQFLEKCALNELRV